jgi:TPR repeat protein
MRSPVSGLLVTTILACSVAAPALAQAPAPFDVAMAHYNLGDFTGARVELEKLARAGEAQAQYNLGVMARDGQGGPKSDADGFAWFRKAADQGHTLAAFNVGVMYDNGIGVAKNYAEAARWYRVAADKGDAAAQYNLGLLYVDGAGVAQDLPTAVSWWRKSADQGYAEAQFNMGVAYANGAGVPVDNVEAYKWLLLAAAGGSKGAVAAVPVIKGAITADQAAQGQAKAAQWKPVK